MIIIKLKAGLGNQMFQYALGRKLALKNSDKLKLDLSNFLRFNAVRGGADRTYGLNQFNIIEDTNGKQILISKLTNIYRTKILRDFNIKFDPKILEKTGNIFLDGYYQSEKYFSDIRSVLIKDFSLKNSIEKESNSPAKQILSKILSSSNPVSVHVRRGDYISMKSNRNYWYECPKEYYQTAVKTIHKKTGESQLFIFSDDINWVKENLTFPQQTIFVSQQGISDAQEIILMSKCKHNIIANSSFSWWGAWLNQNQNKVVIAPKIWTLKNNEQYIDIIPKEWIRI